MQTVLQSFWKVPSWVSESLSSHSSSLYQDLGYIVLSLHIIVQEYMCRVTLDHGGVQERHTSQKSGLSVSQVPRIQTECRSMRRQGSVLQGRVLGGFRVTTVGVNRAATRGSLLDNTRLNGQILTTNCPAATSWLLPTHSTHMAPTSLLAAWLNLSHMAALFTTDQQTSLSLPALILKPDPELPV